MSSSSRLSEDSSLEELVEDHLRRLGEILVAGHSLDEIAREVKALNDLTYSYKLRDDLLKCLLDFSAPDARRNEIRTALKIVHMRVADDQAELQRLHVRSQEIIQRSIKLIKRGQELIDREAHRYTGYELEKCAFCDARGRVADTVCPACHGKCAVLVNRPFDARQ